MINLIDAKTHLRIDHTDDDEYVETLIAAASEYVRELTKSSENPTETQKHAVRLLLGHWYANREAVADRSMVSVPFSLQILIDLNRSGEALI